jgi:hypothetical protein
MVVEIDAVDDDQDTKKGSTARLRTGLVPAIVVPPILLTKNAVVNTSS